jgi:hypothetical protein
LGALFVEIENCDRASLARKAQRDSAPDAACATRHDHDPFI